MTHSFPVIDSVLGNTFNMEKYVLERWKMKRCTCFFVLFGPYNGFIYIGQWD